MLSYTSYWEVARKKSPGFYLAFWSKANGSLCSLGWLRLRINKSTFQEVFFWKVHLNSSDPLPQLSWPLLEVNWVAITPSGLRLVCQMKAKNGQQLLASVCSCLVTECCLVTDRHAPAHVPGLHFWWQRFGCTDKTKWIEWRMTLSQAFLDLCMSEVFELTHQALKVYLCWAVLQVLLF